MAAQEDLQEMIREAAKAREDNKVACKVLFDLAERTGTPIGQLARICDEMGIRVANCQLGCF